ncbi:EAL domain-containing protein [Sphingomonas sp. HITSZ_GF]|uniref:EAL domain-containing protein n=1 Tax=Sphingomonas sp. HITSZ_GF TaxID=3037247 RepID=UPI00240CFEF3|nr:EAL domain-containing protein [Sphingomonas sp. HITSZ_GF]MDG2535692.1 EAL domain-containing protein [Sphingomonas sp. HITSZ_GF]
MHADPANAANEPGLAIAFQPMIATASSMPFAWQAVATANGRSFSQIAAALAPEARPALEMARISAAIAGAAAAGLLDGEALLAIPVGAAGGAAEALLAHLFRTAIEHRVPVARIVVELNADERGDLACVAALAQACVDRGIAIAFDSFAVGPLAVRLLGRFTPRFVKLDAALVRNISDSSSRRVIVEGVLRLARNMDVTLIANGIVRREDLVLLCTMGVRHMQGDWIAPALAHPLPRPHIARREPRTNVPQHRRLAAHQRSGAVRPAAPASIAQAL